MNNKLNFTIEEELELLNDMFMYITNNDRAGLCEAIDISILRKYKKENKHYAFASDALTVVFPELKKYQTSCSNYWWRTDKQGRWKRLTIINELMAVRKNKLAQTSTNNKLKN